MRTIASEVGTSVATVSLALADHPRVNDRTKQRVREASLRLGYLTAQEMEQRRRRPRLPAQRLVRFLVAGNLSRRQTGAALLAGLMGYPGRLGMRLELDAQIDENQAHAPAWVCERAADADGVILYGVLDGDLVEALRHLPVPVVGIGPSLELPHVDLAMRFRCVGFDETAQGRLATRALLHLGHRRIAMVTARGVAGMYYDRWLWGYQLALLEAGLTPDPMLLDNSGGRALSQEGDHAFFEGGAAPTAYIVPDPSHLPLLRAAMARRGLTLRPEQTVLGGSREQAEGKEQAAWPAVAQDTQVLVKTCLETLQAMMGAAPGPYQMVVLPPLIHGLDRLTPPVAP